jgi:hypothetical protein
LPKKVTECELPENITDSYILFLLDIFEKNFLRRKYGFHGVNGG